ncbi:MAG: PQQ-binding-like beta-propeller repeat protein [Mariniblastus sp.]
MSPRQLLQKLDALGIVDPKILARIQAEVENPDKVVKTKAVLSYLVKKQQITEKQALQLVKVSKKEDVIEVAPTPVDEHDSADLMAIKDSRPSVVEEADEGATMMDDGAFAAEVDPDLVVSEVHDPLSMDGTMGSVVQPLGGVAPGFDAGLGGQGLGQAGLGQAGFGAGLDTGMDSGAYQQTDEVAATFLGKKDKKDQWATKWLYIGFGILGAILIGTAVTFIATMGQKPEDMFKAAMDSYNKATYTDATKKFEEFLEQFPDHNDAQTARARRIHSIIRATYDLKNYPEVIQQSSTLLPELAEAEDGGKIELLRDDLGVMLPVSLERITKKATKVVDLEGMKTELVKIKDYKKVIDNPVYITTSLRKVPSNAENLGRIDNNIRTIEGQIAKENEYGKALTAIANLREEGQTDQAFAVYQKLTRNYGDLAGRKALRDLMLTISAKESELVKTVEVSIPSTATERPSIIANSVVLAAKSGEPVEALKGEVVNFLADGSVYGIDVGDGTITWRRFLGYETDIQPQSINDDLILVADEQKFEVMALQRLTGKIFWRAEIGEPFMMPSLGDKVIVVTTKAGKVIQLNSANGQVEQSIQLPQSANLSALISTKEPYIYQAGSYSNLYVLSSQDYSCKEVYYIGHAQGSIATNPVAWSGYVLVAVNGSGYCNLHVLKPMNKGRDLKLVQIMTHITDSPVSSPIQRFGRWMLLTSEEGEMRILELNPTEELSPVSEFAKDRFTSERGLKSYIKSEGSNLWVAGKGIMRYKIKRNQGTFSREVTLEPNDEFISPCQKLDDYLLHIRRRDKSGMLSASLVNAADLKPVWRTDFGGELAGSPMMFGDKLVAVSNQGDLFSIDGGAIGKGYSDDAVRASTVREDLSFNQTIPVGDDMFALLGPNNPKDMLFAKGSTLQKKLVMLLPPADKAACPAVAMGENLIIASTSGQVSLVDPKTGRRMGESFLLEAKPGTRTPWFEPTVLSANTFAIASGATADGVKSVMYVLDSSNPRSLKMTASLESEEPFGSRLVNDGRGIFGVIGTAGNEKLASFSSSDPIAKEQEVALNGSVVAGPWLTQAGLLVHLDDDMLYCFGTDLSPKWEAKLENDKFACDPEIVGAQLMLCSRSGKIQLIDPSTGKTVTEFSVGQPIIHKPFRAGDKMYVSGMDGTVHVVDLNRIGNQ